MIKNILEKILTKAFLESGYELTAQVVLSNRSDLCDYQCDDVFKLAKNYHTSPIEIGEKVVEKLQNLEEFDTYFKEVNFVKPGFINMVLKDGFINQLLTGMITSDRFDIPKEKEETYFLDYGGPNVEKPLHVGHLINAIIGESLKRILQFMGHKTISDTHLGDYGLQIGQVIYGILEDGLKEEDLTLEYLEKTYPKMSTRCKEDDNVLTKCAQITKELQDGNTEYRNLWKKICEISVGDIRRLYQYLDVSFDLWEGESDAYPYIDTVTSQLQEKHLLEDSEGAKIVRVQKQEDTKEIPPLIYQKSNGAYLYGTTDLGTIYERVTKYQPNHILYITDLRQGLHFEQVFRVCEKWGISKGVELEHLGYGTVNGKDGKPFKTRSGDTTKLDDLLQQVKETFKNIKETNQNMKEEDLDKIVNAIIKFADLQNNREKDYIFDIEKFSNVVGKTGPYILYTYLRIAKILNNETLEIQTFNKEIYNSFDRDLRMKVLQLEPALDSAYRERMPHYIAEYVYDICVLTNIFYQNNHVSGLENNQKQQWLLLLTLTNRMIEKLLNLLGIQIPSEM